MSEENNHYTLQTLSQEPLVSIIIVNFNGKALLSSCLESVSRTNYSNFEVIVVDNGSTDGTCAMIKASFPLVQLIESKNNLGYAKGNNLGIINSKGKFIVLLNNDTLVSPQWLSMLIKEANINPECFYQPKILLENTKKINSAGNCIQLFGFAFPYGIGNDADLAEFARSREVSYASGACVLASRHLIDTVGLLDESDLFTFYEDVNWGWRGLMNGNKTVYVPSSVIFHRWGGSWGSKLTPKKFHLLERGRLASITRNYSSGTLAILLPSLAAVEFMVLLYGMLNGVMAEKIKVYSDILKSRTILKNERRLLQYRRVKSDDYVISSFCNCLLHVYLKNNAVVLNELLTFLTKIVRRCM